MSAKTHYVNPADPSQRVEIKYPFRKRGEDGILREYYADGTAKPIVEQKTATPGRFAQLPASCDDDFAGIEVTV